MSTEPRTGPGAQWKPDVEVPVYSLKEVAAHKQKNDMWIVVHGKVYDVSNYFQDHPGGAEVIEEVAGTDATVAFEDVGHSEDAREMLQPMLVGVLNAEEAKANKPKKAVRVVSRAPAPTPVKPSGSKGVYLSAVALTALIAVGARIAVTARTMNHPLLRKFPSPRAGPNDFWNGVILTTAAFLVAGTYTVKRVSKLFSVGTGFTRYPPHFKAASSVPTRQVTGFLAPQDYKKLPLAAIDQLSPNTVRYTFTLPTPTTILGLPIGQHVSIRGTTPDGRAVSRSYTPTSNNSDPGRLELVIKLYDDGLLTGQYLARLRVGDLVEFRGPKGAMRYRRGWAPRLGMVAGGTGITPMYQLIRAICEDPADLTEVSLIYANRSEEDILLRDELDRFARLYPRNFRVWYLLDRPAAGWPFGSGYVTEELMAERLPSADEGSKVLLCGPPGMVKAAKGSLAQLGFQVPGGVSKMHDQVFTF